MVVYLIKCAVVSSVLNLIQEIFYYSANGHINGHVKEVLQSDQQVLINFQITSFPIILITKIILKLHSVVQPQFLNTDVQEKAENHLEFLYSK